MLLLVHPVAAKLSPVLSLHTWCHPCTTRDTHMLQARQACQQHQATLRDWIILQVQL